MKTMKKAISLVLAMQIIFWQSLSYGQASQCSDADKEVATNMRQQLSDAGAHLQTAQTELAKEKAKGHRTLNKASKTVTSLAAAGTVLSALFSWATFKSGGSGLGAGLGGVAFAFFAVIGAIVTAISGLVAWATNDSQQEIRIEDVEKQIEQYQAKIAGLNTALTTLCQ